MKPVTLRTASLAVFAALALAACATPTPYQAAREGGPYGGYAEQRLESNRYRVTFAGNSVTSREQVEMSLLLRAAELTLQDGYDWFATVNRATDRDTRYSGLLSRPPYDPLYSDRYGPVWGPNWRYYRGGAWSRWGDDSLREIERYEASAEVVMGRGQKSESDPNAFDAREVIANIRERVGQGL